MMIAEIGTGEHSARKPFGRSAAVAVAAALGPEITPNRRRLRRCAAPTRQSFDLLGRSVRARLSRSRRRRRRSYLAVES